MSAAGAPGPRRIAVRLAADDAATLDTVAARTGLPVSGVVRAGIAALAAELDGRRAAVPAPPSAHDRDVSRLVMAVNRIGANANQVVRKIHAGSIGAVGDDELILALLESLQEAVEAVTSG